MKGVAGIQPFTADAFGRQPRHCTLQIVGRAGQYGIGAVVGGHCQTREFIGAALDPLCRSEYRGHPTARGQAAEEAASLGHQPCPVLQTEDPRDTCSRVLADAVAQHHVGFNAPRLPEPSQAHLHREQCGLGVGGLPQRLFAIRAVHSKITSSKGFSRTSATTVRALVQRLGEHRLGVEQLPGHAGVLAALTGEQPRRLRRIMGFSANQTGSRAVVRERTE